MTTSSASVITTKKTKTAKTDNPSSARGRATPYPDATNSPATQTNLSAQPAVSAIYSSNAVPRVSTVLQGKFAQFKEDNDTDDTAGTDADNVQMMCAECEAELEQGEASVQTKNDPVDASEDDISDDMAGSEPLQAKTDDAAEQEDDTYVSEPLQSKTDGTGESEADSNDTMGESAPLQTKAQGIDASAEDLGDSSIEPVQLMCSECEAELNEGEASVQTKTDPVGESDEDVTVDMDKTAPLQSKAEATMADEDSDEAMQAKPVQPKSRKNSKRRRSILNDANKGLANARSPLPHHDRIQSSFGHHDISNVRADVGGAAGQASRRMGALAYASGDRIGFRQSPGLHLAAHEAAHTVQQRSGLKLPGNVGKPGDRYEKHADQVADAVAAGESAEPLLDSVTPVAGNTATATAPANGDGISGAVQHRLASPAVHQSEPKVEDNQSKEDEEDNTRTSVATVADTAESEQTAEVRDAELNNRTIEETAENDSEMQSASEESLPPKFRNNAVLDSELAAATSGSPANAKKTEGGPTILELGQAPPESEVSEPPRASDIEAENESVTEPPVAEQNTAADTAHTAEQSQEMITTSLPDEIANNQSAEAGVNPEEGAEESQVGEEVEELAAEEDESEEEEQESAQGENLSEEQATAKLAGQAASGGPALGEQAGADMVPPADPQTLKSEIPERPITQEEFIAVAESEQSEEDDQAEVQQLLAQLRADAEQEKAQVQLEADNHKAQLQAKKTARIASAQMIVDAQKSSVQSLFSASRDNLTQNFNTSKATLEEEANNDIQQIDTDTEARIADVESQFTQRQTDLTAFAENERLQPPIIARQEADRADSELETAAREAEEAGEAEARRYPGDDDAHPEQREAAREVGYDSAADIREKKPEIAADLMSRADEFSGQYMEYATTVNERISSTKEQLIPALQESAGRAKTSLEEGKQTSLQALEARYQTDMQALNTAEATALEKLDAGGEKTIAQIDKTADQAVAEVDAAASALILEIDNNVEETETAVSSEQEPFVPGINDMVEASRASLRESSQRGRAQLTTSVTTAMTTLDSIITTFQPQAENIVTTAQSSADSILTSADGAQQQTLESRRQSAQDAISALTSQHEQVIADVLAEVDSSIEEARNKIRGINDEFREGIREAADESIEEAIKPRTDDTESRAHEAAEEAGGAWWEGLLSAIGQIVIGLVILVVVAVIVAAIAAAFGVILTAWTAIMIAGAILLAVGLVLSIINRAGQWDQFEGSTLTRVGKVVGLALFDTVGGTGIYEGFSGTDIVTGRELSDAEQTERGVMGWFTAISLVLGARAAIKGPPGGAYVRPMSMRPTGIRSFFSGWRGWRIGGLKALRSSGLVLGEMYLGMRQGFRNFGEWFRTKIMGREPTRLPPELVERVGNISDAETRRGNPVPEGEPVDPLAYSERGPVGELPYEMPPETRVVRPGEPLDVSTLDPSKRYLWVMDPEGNFIIAPEQQPGFAPNRSGTGRPGVVKHGDLTPGVHGQYRGAARAGGELRFRNGQWHMDHNSSYGFARTDQNRLGKANLDAAIEALGETGTDTSNIVPRYRNSYRNSLPPRRGAGARTPVPTRTPRDDEDSEQPLSE